MSFEVEWSDWWLYQQIFEVANNLHDIGKSVIANTSEDAIKGSEDVQEYFLHNFVSLFDTAGVTLEEVAVYWLKRQVEQNKRAPWQADQVIAALELLTAEPRQEHNDSDIPIHGVIS